MKIPGRGRNSILRKTCRTTTTAWFFLFLAFYTLNAAFCFASAGTEGAAFLNIPVGGGPAALGSAYTALANDAYAATWNPGGLGFLDSSQFSGQHLAYLDSLHYEHLSFAVPLKHNSACTSNDCARSGLGGSVQYLGSGDIDGTDASGASIGSFSSYYASYNLAFGHSFNNRTSLGLTSKLISARIADVSATAYAVDMGGMYRPVKGLTLAATLMNLGSKLKFEQEGDSLPLAFHLAAAYQASTRFLITSEAVYPKTGLASVRFGGEWRPLSMVALRAGYRTDTLKGLSLLAGLSTGLGIDVWGQELAYAWLPYGDLGSTHYISLRMKFGEAEKNRSNLIQYQQIKRHRTATHHGDSSNTPQDKNEDMDQLMQLLTNGDDTHLSQNPEKTGNPQP